MVKIRLVRRVRSNHNRKVRREKKDVMGLAREVVGNGGSQG